MTVTHTTDRDVSRRTTAARRPDNMPPIRVCISWYPDNGYPDLSVNFTAAKNPDILNWKSGCCGCLQKWWKLCLRYCGGTSNYCKINSHASKEWMVTLVS